MGSRVVTEQPQPKGDKMAFTRSVDPQQIGLTAAAAGSLSTQEYSSPSEQEANGLPPVINVRDLEFSFDGQVRLFSHLDFTLSPGEKVGLLGPNGSGKTTFLHILMGLIPACAGTIEILGRVRRHPSDFRDLPGQVGLLFQDSDDQLFCPTVAEDVAFGPFNQGKSPREVREIVRQTLDKLGLAGWESRITYRLSGGEKRLVALATVLAMEPQLLLLDEPTAGLDESACARVEKILSALPQSMVIVSHDRGFLQRICHRVLVLKDGRLSLCHA